MSHLIRMFYFFLKIFGITECQQRWEVIMDDVNVTNQVGQRTLPPYLVTTKHTNNEGSQLGGWSRNLANHCTIGRMDMALSITLNHHTTSVVIPVSRNYPRLTTYGFDPWGNPQMAMIKIPITTYDLRVTGSNRIPRDKPY